MAGLTAEIEVLRKEMDRSQVELSNMHLELGEVAARWHDAINYALFRIMFPLPGDYYKPTDSNGSAGTDGTPINME